LEAERYDLVHLQHAYHHIEALEHVADEIAKSLKPNGIFAISDYIGANFLQRTPRQRDLCGAIWRAMPERCRIGKNGHVVPKLRIPSKASLPPYEAVRSEDILDVLTARFDILEFVSFGALLLPLFNGFVHCYTDAAEDQEFIRMMWDLDQWLIKTGAIEPNYMKAMLVPRPDDAYTRRP
jgi:SAM-dependent methyltransferase